MIPYVPNKKPDWDFIEDALCESRRSGRWANFGPASLRLEAEIHRLLRLPKDLRVVACSSGTAAIFALVQMNDFLGAVSWAVSSFTFACNRQGPLRNATVIDCDERGLMPGRPDGVFTDVFGTAETVPDCAVIDSALAFDKPHERANDALSFHHTKPWGFGEGGAAIVKAEHERLFRSIINFGSLTGEESARPWSFNGKMSDPSAAFILDRLRQLTGIRAVNTEQYQRIANLAAGLGLAPIGPCRCTPASLPLLCNGRTSNDILELKKYYQPIMPTPNAVSIYERIVNVPCHEGVGLLSDSELRSILVTLL